MRFRITYDIVCPDSPECSEGSPSESGYLCKDGDCIEFPSGLIGGQAAAWQEQNRRFIEQNWEPWELADWLLNKGGVQYRRPLMSAADQYASLHTLRHGLSAYSESCDWKQGERVEGEMTTALHVEGGEGEWMELLGYLKLGEFPEEPDDGYLPERDKPHLNIEIPPAPWWFEEGGDCGETPFSEEEMDALSGMADD